MTAMARIVIVAGLAIAGLIGLVVREGQARASETEALFAMEAVDPRALLSGHYVIVNLQRLLPKGRACAPVAEQVAQSDQWPPKGWLAINVVNGRGEVAGVAPNREDALKSAPLAVRGAYRCEGAAPEVEDARAREFIDLGVDRFHINQTEAMRIERILRDQTPGQEARAFAIISIGKDGRARIKGVEIDGQRLELTWR
jgi:hypothetical protein